MAKATVTHKHLTAAVRAEATAKATTAATEVTPAPEPSCQACRFHRVLANEALGRCRRFPPVIYSHLGYGPNLHPQVAPDDWCGEFKPKE